MTRDEILNMPAGQEMDLLVAEKVLKLDSNEWNKRFFNNRTKYSTDIKAAWEVVEQLVKLGFWVSLSHNGNKIAACWDFRVVDEKRNIREIEIEHTAPLAICRAALLAVMEAE